MANQKAMNEQKFERIMWRNERDIFKAKTDVHRNPFGGFTVTFEMNANTGETEMQVKSWCFSELDSEKRNYKTFKQAVNAAVMYFGKIDELVKNVSNQAKYEAETAYKRAIVKELVRLKECAI